MLVVRMPRDIGTIPHSGFSKRYALLFSELPNPISHRDQSRRIK
jgi:hypothetical protein